MQTLSLAPWRRIAAIPLAAVLAAARRARAAPGRLSPERLLAMAAIQSVADGVIALHPAELQIALAQPMRLDDVLIVEGG